MKTRNLTCIGCPMGCAITAQINQDGTPVSIEGNSCKIGLEYAKTELISPMRNISSTVTLVGARNGAVRLPCKTAAPIPKGKIDECMQEIANTTVKAPVGLHSVLIKNVAGTGVDIIAAKSAE